MLAAGWPAPDANWPAGRAGPAGRPGASKTKKKQKNQSKHRGSPYFRLLVSIIQTIMNACRNTEKATDFRTLAFALATTELQTDGRQTRLNGPPRNHTCEFAGLSDYRLKGNLRSAACHHVH